MNREIFFFSTTKISLERVYDICKSVTLERRLPWDVVIQENEPGDT